MTGAPLLELREVTAGYGGQPVLRAVSLAVAPGEVVAVLGANGSGKSTLIRVALGLLPPLTGTATLFRHPSHRFRDRRRLGYVPQRVGAGGGVPATVTELVSTGRLARHRFPRPYSGGDRRAVAEAIATVGLAEQRHRPVATLSGGQQQRALIARALATGPDLLVLDEPTAGVDAASQEAFARALDGFVTDGGTVVLVAHELGPLEPLVTRVVVLVDGRVARDEPWSRATGSAARPGVAPLATAPPVHPHGPGVPADRWHPPGRWQPGPDGEERPW